MFSKLNTLIDAISKEKNVKKDTVVSAIEGAFISVVKKGLGEYGIIANLSAHYEPENDSVAIYQYKKVISNTNEDGSPKVLNKHEEVTSILHKDAVLSDPEVEVGDELGFLVDKELTSLNRKNIQIFKQILIQKIADEERRELMSSLTNKKGQIVSGTIKVIDQNGNALVDLGSTTAMLYKRDMLETDSLSQNSRVRALLVDIARSDSRKNEIILSRKNPMFLVRKLEEECPKVEDGTIEVVKISREGGLRSKIVVRSNDHSVNALSEILGENGYRIQSIIDELEGEKINIILETNNRSELLANTLKPGTIESFVEYEDRIDVIVDEEELGKIIGKKGSNLRAASSIMEKRINVISSAGLSKMKSASRKELAVLSSLKDLEVEKLINHNIFSLKNVISTSVEFLSKVLEKDETTVKEIVQEAVVKTKDPSFLAETDTVSLVESYGLPRVFVLPTKENKDSVSAERRLREELSAFKLK